ncbi:hypothetical protein SAMN04487906_0420 [Zhouia amylolytica]|uniref:Uncharacterized protein n=1 Tax=Zhouia amylolytica TaxID=376730 RepID=A0A1I6PQJ0_9FLAO|nr:DUF6427 family protein [Zhouia amylolytica]MCQ0112398.1 hypothetical protein [Zhouia amylolytica]SFS42390.1 hypothetical protein SAMN04487906_0420 [Zhouia amylolytica]
MISSIFGKTKPINFIFIGFFLFLYFWSVQFFVFDSAFKGTEWLEKFGLCLLLILSALLVDFISKKNDLSQSNSYPILLFVLLMCMYPPILKSSKFIIANFFVLLAVRRLMSLRTNMAIKQKLFDASLLIGFSFLWYQWSLLFVLLVYTGVLFYDAKDYRNWLVPVIGIGAVLFFVVTYYYITDNISGLIEVFTFHVEFNIQKYKYLSFSIPIVTTLIIGVFALLAYLVNIKIRSAKAQKAMALVVASLFIGLGISTFSEDVNVAELIFIAFPLAMIIANYLQITKVKWVKETVLWIFVLLPFLALVL